MIRRLNCLILLLLTITIGGPTHLFAAETLVDSYPESNYDTYASLGDGNRWRGQAIHLSRSAQINKVDFYLMKTHDSVSGNLKVVIKSATGTTGIDAVPTGPILAVSNLISCSIIPSEGFGLVSFTFNPNFIASGGDITLYLDTTEIIFFGYALFFAVDSHSTHPGNYFGTNDGGANWYTVSDMDSIFYLYEEIEEPQLIELASFDAIASREKVTLQWVTGSEIDNEGFNLYRAESEDGEYVKINPSLIPAEGSPTQGASYKFVDNNTRNRKTYWYKLEDVDIYGNSTVHGPVSALPRLMYGVKR